MDKAKPGRKTIFEIIKNLIAISRVFPLLSSALESSNEKFIQEKLKGENHFFLLFFADLTWRREEKRGRGREKTEEKRKPLSEVPGFFLYSNHRCHH